MAAARGPRQQPPCRTAAAIKLSSITHMLIWLLRKLGALLSGARCGSEIAQRHAESNRSGVQMTQNHSQFVSELLPARRCTLVIWLPRSEARNKPYDLAKRLKKSGLRQVRISGAKKSQVSHNPGFRELQPVATTSNAFRPPLVVREESYVVDIGKKILESPGRLNRDQSKTAG
jgi:hypothetical protein